MSRFKVFSFIVLLVIGCGKSKIEGETPEELSKSVIEIKNQLPEEKQKKFKEDVVTVATQGSTSFKQLGHALGGLLNKEGGNTIKERALYGVLTNTNHIEKIRNKTPSQIFRLADSIEVYQELEDIQNTIESKKNRVSELDSLLNRITESKKSLENLNVRSRITNHPNEYLNHNVARIAVENDTDKKIRIVELHCEYKSDTTIYEEGSMKIELDKTINKHESDEGVWRFGLTSGLRNTTLYKNSSLNCDPIGAWGPSSQKAIYQTRVSIKEEFFEKEVGETELRERLNKQKSKLDSLTRKRDSLHLVMKKINKR